MRNRKTRAVIASNMAAQGWEGAAEAIKSLSPNKTSALLLAADAIVPGTLHQMISTPEGSRDLVGLHNMITEDVRDRRSPEGKRLNSLKADPRAIEAIQGALVALDRDIADTTEDPALRRRLEHSVEVRERALAAGVFSHVPDELLSDDDRAARRRFYVQTKPEDLEALTEASQRITDKFYEAHLEGATPKTKQRTPSAELRATERKYGRFATVNEMMGDGSESKPLGDGADLVRIGRDQYAIRVEGMTIPVASDQRASDILRRAPIVESIGVGKAESLMGQTLVSKAYLDPASARGLAHVKALKRQIIANSVRSGLHNTPTDATSGVLDGKPNWRTTNAATALGIKGEYRVAPPSEGLLLSRFIGERDKTMSQIDDKVRERFGIPKGRGDKTTWSGNPKPELGRYTGPVSSIDRDVNEHAGWMIRSPKTKGQLGSIADAVPTSQFMRPGPKKRVVSDWEKALPEATQKTIRDQSSDATLRRVPPTRLVESANKIIRDGRHPDLAASDAVVARGVLESAFKRRDFYARHDPTASTAFFQAPKGRDVGKWLSEVFPTDTAVSTTGYTVALPPETSAAPTADDRTYRVRYLTADGISVDDRHTIIGHRSTFRTHHIGDEGGIPTVYLVSENAAADLAADNTGGAK